MQTVLIQFVGDGGGAGERCELGPGDVVRFGRGAPDARVEIVLPHQGVPRLAGEITAAEDHWTLTNFSPDKTYVVENPEGAGEHVKVPPLRLATPIPFEISRVVLPAGQGLVAFFVFAPMHAYLEGRPGTLGHGERTLTAFPLDCSSKYFLVLLALCEPRLRDQSHVAIPTVAQVVRRLRPLPSCADLNENAVTFHIDYLARTKLRVRHDEPGLQRLDTKRAALVSLALRFNLVREEHLRLLPPRVATGSGV
jgi:hypothetical protein